MLNLNRKKILLPLMTHFGHILTAIGQVCNIPDPVLMCTEDIQTGSEAYIDFYRAINYTSCSCTLVSTQNARINIISTLVPGVGCGMPIIVTNTPTKETISFTCTNKAASSINLSPNDSLSIQIMKDNGHISYNSNYCFKLSFVNNSNFTLSCVGNDIGTTSPATSAKSSLTSMHLSTTVTSASSSDTTLSTMTSDKSSTSITTTEAVLATSSSTLSQETATTPGNKDIANKSELDITIVAGAAGGGGACLIIICIVVIVCCRRSRTKQKVEKGAGDQKHEHNHIYHNDSSIPVDDNYDLTDNVLYNSVCIPDQEMPEIPQNRNNNKNTGYEDAEVVRTNRQNLSHMYSTPVSVQPEGTDKGDNSAKEDKEITPDSKNDESSISIYAVANKKKKISEKENCEIPVYAMPMKKKNTNSREIPSTKPKPVVAKKPSKLSERRVNDDGLCYADLEISNSVRNETRSSLNNSNESDVQYADVRI